MLTQPITDEAQLRSALESIQPGDGHANFGELGRGIRALAETTRGPSISISSATCSAQPCPPTLPTWCCRPTSTLVLHSVAKGPRRRTGRSKASMRRPSLSDPKDPKHSRVHAVVAGFGTPAATKTVSLVVNGKTLRNE